MYDLLSVFVTDSCHIFQILWILFYIISGKFSECFLTLSDHDTLKFRVLCQEFLRIIRNFRTAGPEVGVRKNLCQICHQFFYKRNIPDITGHAYHIRMLQINIPHDIIFLLINGIFLQHNMICILCCIRLQIINSKIRMNIFCIACCK